MNRGYIFCAVTLYICVYLSIREQIFILVFNELCDNAKEFHRSFTCSISTKLASVVYFFICQCSPLYHDPLLHIHVCTQVIISFLHLLHMHKCVWVIALSLHFLSVNTSHAEHWLPTTERTAFPDSRMRKVIFKP